MPIWAVTLAANKAERVASANPNRICISIQNESSADVYYGHDAGVSISGPSQGFKIRANGGFLEDEFYKGDVYLISSQAVTVVIAEDVKE